MRNLLSLALALLILAGCAPAPLSDASLDGTVDAGSLDTTTAGDALPSDAGRSDAVVDGTLG